MRIEDIDETRCKPEYEAAIYEDLRWLGLAWEEPVRRQSEHYGDYRAALAKLDAMGLIYPAFESRAEIARMATSQDPDGAPLYAGAGKSLSAAERKRRIEAGEPYALRLDMDAAMARTGPLTVERRRPRQSRPILRHGATSFSPARIPRPAITSRWSSMTPRRASLMWCAGRTCFTPPPCTASFRNFSACRRRVTGTIG